MAIPPTGPMDWPISLSGDDYWGSEIDCDVCGQQITAAGPYTLDAITDALTMHIEQCVTSQAFAARYLNAGG